MKKFNVAIIGLGKIGFGLDAKIAEKYILSYARAFRRHGGFNLAAGFDIDSNKLKSFEKIYKAPGYPYQALKRRLKDVGVVVISTPASSHFQVFKDVISVHQPRMIIMEKPLALDLKQAKKIVEISKKNKIPLYVNYFRRIDPGINQLRQYIKQKKWGELKHVNIYYGQGLLNNGSHFIDLAAYLLGYPDNIKLSRGENKDNPDFIFYYKHLLVCFQSSLGLDYSLKEMDFIFTKARVRYTHWPLTQLMLPKPRPCFNSKELAVAGNKNLHLDLERYMSSVAKHIYNILSHKSELISTGQTALKTLEICLGIIKKAEKA